MIFAMYLMYVDLVSQSAQLTISGQDLEPRPGFPSGPEQQYLGPLVLDEGTKIQVPAPINTFLRDYQREGVKFFWKQYQEGRGGLLGDDMGLVSENLIILTT